jgi:hypothetical protein
LPGSTPSPVSVSPKSGSGKKQPKLDEPVPFRGDQILYFIINVALSGFFFFIFGANGLLGNILLNFYEKFLSVGFLLVISDIMAGYIASFPVAYITNKRYSSEYFNTWYNGTDCDIKGRSRSWNIIRNALRWVFDSLIYVSGIIDLVSIEIFGVKTIETRILAYVPVKAISALIAYLLAKYLTELSIFAEKEKKKKK